ncbi:peptidase U62 modulator of DNA gyrase [Bacteroides coprosuis DSM 18011]|uniref:Peptidase U62 modulator of DNA gyrase n=1 Tax=Bacteroides coprosuis DSM 18011 TaxID=679937 RepID=F3ZRX2_9BACE|nr:MULTISPECIES: TldD/PmbA family protein [Bacteroides]EGJ70778.1 peptidase U62 modulator of DNA gyrase [Bacteroides coprosuis DSM 18011]
MISTEYKKLSEWAMDFALKNGCQSAKVILQEGVNSSYSLRDAKIETLEQASEMALGFHLYVDGRFGSFSTNRLDKKELEQFIKTGIEATRYLAVDKARTLPTSDRYYKGDLPNLQLYDNSFENIHPDEKVAIAKKVAHEILGKDNRILSVSSSYSDGSSSVYQITSNGFEGETDRSWYNVSSSVSIKGEGEARPSDFWYDSAIYFSDLNTNGIGAKALERTLRKLGQKKVKSGKYTMLIDSLTSSRLLSPLLGATYGNALQQKNSFLEDKLNEKIGSSLFTLYDRPHIKRASGARYFDGEGVATQTREIFTEGVLNTYFIDTYVGNKMGITPTISGPSLLEMKLGPNNLEELISSLDKGILVTAFNGGNSNSSTGDFSFGVEGFLIEHGRLTQPISEMNITGNLITLWASLIGVGNDPKLSSSWRIPSLVFDNVDFSGL